MQTRVGVLLERNFITSLSVVLPNLIWQNSKLEYLKLALRAKKKDAKQRGKIYCITWV